MALRINYQGNQRNGKRKDEDCEEIEWKVAMWLD